jgi:hypothetical protein
LYHYRATLEAISSYPESSTDGYLFFIERRLPFGSWVARETPRRLLRHGPAERLAIKLRFVAGGLLVALQLLVGWLLIELHARQGWTFDRLFLLAPLPLLVWAWVIEHQVYGMGLTWRQAFELLTGTWPEEEEKPAAATSPADLTEEIVTVTVTDADGRTYRTDGIVDGQAIMHYLPASDDSGCTGRILLNGIHWTSESLPLQVNRNGDAYATPQPSEFSVFEDPAPRSQWRSQLRGYSYVRRDEPGADYATYPIESPPAGLTEEQYASATLALNNVLDRVATRRERQSLILACCDDWMRFDETSESPFELRCELHCTHCNRRQQVVLSAAQPDRADLDRRLTGYQSELETDAAQRDGGSDATPAWLESSRAQVTEAMRRELLRRLTPAEEQLPQLCHGLYMPLETMSLDGADAVFHFRCLVCNRGHDARTLFAEPPATPAAVAEIEQTFFLTDDVNRLTFPEAASRTTEFVAAEYERVAATLATELRRDATPTEVVATYRRCCQTVMAVSHHHLTVRGPAKAFNVFELHCLLCCKTGRVNVTAPRPGAVTVPRKPEPIRANLVRFDRPPRRLLKRPPPGDSHGPQTGKDPPG